jgi:hypothetical protein
MYIRARRKEANRKLTEIPEYEVWLESVGDGADNKAACAGMLAGSINIRHLSQEAAAAFKQGDEFFVEFVKA